MTKKKALAFTPDRGYSLEDWNDVSDSPELTAQNIAKARSFADVFPDLLEETGVQPVKKRISILVDQDVVEAFQASGAGWQTRIAEAVKNAKPR